MKISVTQILISNNTHKKDRVFSIVELRIESIRFGIVDKNNIISLPKRLYCLY